MQTRFVLTPDKNEINFDIYDCYFPSFLIGI